MLLSENRFRYGRPRRLAIINILPHARHVCFDTRSTYFNLRRYLFFIFGLFYFKFCLLCFMRSNYWPSIQFLFYLIVLINGAIWQYRQTRIACDGMSYVHVDQTSFSHLTNTDYWLTFVSFVLELKSPLISPINSEPRNDSIQSHENSVLPVTINQIKFLICITSRPSSL